MSKNTRLRSRSVDSSPTHEIKYEAHAPLSDHNDLPLPLREIPLKADLPEETPLTKSGQKLIQSHLNQRIELVSNLSIAVNVILLILKVGAYYISGSISVLASMADSCLDIVSQLILCFAEQSTRLPSDQLYPAGRSRMESLAVVLTAAVMGMASFEIMQQAVTRLVENASSITPGTDVNMPPFVFWTLAGATVTKALLFLLCNSLADSSLTAMALAEDHRNDVLTNGMAIATAMVACYHPLLWWCDPLGAIFIALFILISWLLIAKEQMEEIVGKSAPIELLQRFAEIAKQHNDILQVDVVRAYHFGRKFLVELEIVLPKDMTVFVSHDIAISLQQRMEQEDLIERAFVHVDYEFRMINEHEHDYDTRIPISTQHKRGIVAKFF